MLFFALGDSKVPDARYFAFWWNIGFIRVFFLGGEGMGGVYWQLH